MQLQVDGGAKGKQIWTILSHWNISSTSFRCQRRYIFYNVNDQLLKRDKVTAVIYYYTKTELRNVTLPIQNNGGVNVAGKICSQVKPVIKLG